MTVTGLGTRSSVGLLGLFAVLLLLPGVGAAAVQEGVIVDVGMGAGKPGTTVPVGITVTVPEGTRITAIEQEIRFEKRVVSFVRAEVGPQGAAADVKVTASEEADRDPPDLSILRLKATAARPLGSGAVVDVLFRINDDVKLDTRSPLKNKARVQIAGRGGFSDAEGTDGVVIVTDDPAIFGCFFYMH